MQSPCEWRAVLPCNCFCATWVGVALKNVWWEKKRERETCESPSLLFLLPPWAASCQPREGEFSAKARHVHLKCFKGTDFPCSKPGLPLHVWTALGDILMHFICFCTKWRFANADANHDSWVIWPDCFTTKTPGEKNTSTFCWHFPNSFFLLLFCWADFSFQTFL